MIEMGCCRDCCWWEVSAQAQDSGKRFCQLATSDDGVALHAETPIWAVATDGGEAIVFTSPDFGCVQFEALPGLEDGEIDLDNSFKSGAIAAFGGDARSIYEKLQKHPDFLASS